MPIEDCLPDADSANYLSTLEELVVIELEFHGRNSDNEVRIEPFLERFPALRSPAILQRLLSEEAHIRSQSPSPLRSDELRHRFGTALTESAIAATCQLPEKTPQKAECPERIGRYPIQRELGRGAFAIVYLGTDESLKRDVAIKWLRAVYLEDEGIRQRILREAMAVARLQHPGIVPIHEVGEWSNRPFIVSDFIDGAALSTELTSQTTTLNRSQSVELTRAVAEAAHYAHQCGIVHRDIKPANIKFITQSGYIREDLLNTLLLFPELAKNQSEFTFTYLHPGDYYLTVIADMDGDGFPSPGDITHARRRVTVEPKSKQKVTITDMNARN